MSDQHQGELSAAAANGNVLPLSVQETVDHMTNALNRAAEAYLGRPGDPLELPDPKAAGMDRRADIPSADLPSDREAVFRDAVAEFGPGRATDENAGAVGLGEGYTAVFEGGQVQKMVAQLEVALNDPVTPPGSVILAASPERRLDQKERASTARILNRRFNIDLAEDDVPDTEYGVARFIAEHLEGFEQHEADLDYNYTLNGNTAPGGDEAKPEERGRFRHVGTIGGGNIPVVLLRIDREYYEGNSERKYRLLDDHGKMRLIAQLLREEGSDIQQVGLVTGATYLPSRLMDSMRTEREFGMPVRVISYGTETLARVKGEPAATPPKIGQLAGEAHLAWQRLQAFIAETQQ